MTQLIASHNRWLAWMDSAAWVYLGTISYSTYLYHELAGELVTRAVGSLPKVVIIVAGVTATYLVASISYYAVEKPFLRFRAQIESRKRIARVEMVTQPSESIMYFSAPSPDALNQRKIPSES